MSSVTSSDFAVSRNVKNIILGEFEKFNCAKISPGQLDYGQKLGLDVDEDTTVFDFNRMVNEFNRSEKSSISRLQRLQILDLGVDAKIASMILRTEIKSMDQINYTGYKTIMGVFSKRGNGINLRTDDRYEIRNEKWSYGYQVTKQGIDGIFWFLKSDYYLMVDVDDDTESVSFESLDVISRRLALRARVYKTTKGFHVFVTSEEIPRSDQRSDTVMSEFGCDLWYQLFSIKFGYKVRLSRKNGRPNEVIAEYLYTVGDPEIPELPEIIDYLRIHDQYVRRHSAE